MKNRPRSRFWKIYRAVIGTALLLIAGFFLFFYDYIGAYEKSQPAYAVTQYVRALTKDDLHALFMNSASMSSTTLESPERIAGAYCEAVWNTPGEFTTQPDYASSTDYLRQFTVAKGDRTIAAVAVEGESGGRYGFQVWRIQSVTVVTEDLSIPSTDYTITVPEGSTVVVSGRVLDEQYLSKSNAAYSFTHPLESAASVACDEYTITNLLSVPDVRCMWNGIDCVGELVDGEWRFAYPDSMAKTYTISAPSEATLTVNGIVLDSTYLVQTDVPYTYSIYDSKMDALPTKKVYRISGLLREPSVTAELNGVTLICTVNEGAFDYPYPEELMYRQIICAPLGRTVYVNGHILNENCPSECVPAYAELFSGSDVSVYMDRYVLSALYGVSDDVKIEWNGTELCTESTEEGRVTTCRALYPDSDSEEVRSLAVSFCKDYFAYTAGGYKNTDENLSRVLQYLLPNSNLYKRINRSKESVSFVTPVTKQIFQNLSVDTAEKLSDSVVVCSVSYDIDQWTYQIKRTYSGKLWLAFELQKQGWVLTDMLTDIK